MIDTKCPVCGNPGIPDYLQADVICPHCGSDLKIYRTLAQAETDSSKSAKRYKILAIALPILVAVLIGAPAYSLLKKSANTSVEAIARRELTISQLSDSLSTLEAKVKAMTRNESEGEKYTVMRNDCPWKIVYKFFGIRKDWMNLSTKIAKDNGIWDEKKSEWKNIHPGQVLIINK